MIPSPSPVFQFFKTDGNPAVGYKLYTYLAGTTTDAATYQDASGTTAHTNPIILDVNGSASIFIDPAVSYKYVLKTSADAVVSTWDNVLAYNPAAEINYSSETVTIADGSASITQTMVLLDTEAAAATDDLTNLIKTGAAVGDIVYLSAVSADRAVVVKHGTGAHNISTSGGADYTLEPGHWLVLQYGGSYWKEVNASLSKNAIENRLTGLIETHFHRRDHNEIINGCFRNWQRATSQTSSGYGSDDRWVNEHSGTTKTHGRQAFTLGQTDVPGNPEYFSRTAVSSVAGGGNYCRKVQKIAGVETLSGKTVTLSFYASADAAKNIAIELVQDFGTGGSASAAVTAIGAQKILLSTSWQRYTATIAIPSVSGKIIGSNNNDSLDVYFWFDAGSSFNARTDSLGQQSGTFDIWGVQLVEGDVASDFEARFLADEEALCKRYYAEGSGFRMTSVYSTGVGQVEFINFPVTMRSAPTITATPSDFVGVSFTSVNTVLSYTDGFRYVFNTSTAVNSCGVGLVDWTAEAEI